MELTWVAAQAQSAAGGGDLFPHLNLLTPIIIPLPDKINHRMGGPRIKLGAVGIGQSSNIAGKFDGCQLHPQANTQKRHFLFAGVGDRHNFTRHPSFTKAPRHQDPMTVGQQLRRGVSPILPSFGNILGADIVQHHPGIVGNSPVDQGLMQALIRLFEIHIFADNDNTHRMSRILDPHHQFSPGLQFWRAGPNVEQLENLVIQPFLMELQGNFVDVFHVRGGDHRVTVNTAKKGDLGFQLIT